MSPEPKIERYEVITPESITPDTYENIVVKTTTGTEVKVNKKHAHLHQLFYDACEQRRALKLGYATYMNKEYVHTAELFDGKPPVEKQVERITAGVKKEQLPKSSSNTMTNEMWNEKQRAQSRSIERQVSAKIAFEFARGAVVKDTLDNAEQIYQWISGIGSSPEPSPEATKQVLQLSKPEKGSDVSTDRDLSAIKSLPEFLTAINEDFKVAPSQALKILDKENWDEVADSFEVCYLTIMRSVKANQ